jgi:hypothetical protein
MLYIQLEQLLFPNMRKRVLNKPRVIPINYVSKRWNALKMNFLAVR